MTRADPDRMHQVLTNLLTNALKFTPAGGSVTVTVEAAGDSATVGVVDTGIGIPSEDHTRVFDRFWRGAEAGAVAGSGIGLTVVAELVRAQAGTIHLDSALGQGTRVTVTLPRA